MIDELQLCDAGSGAPRAPDEVPGKVVPRLDRWIDGALVDLGSGDNPEFEIRKPEELTGEGCGTNHFRLSGMEQVMICGIAGVGGDNEVILQSDRWHFQIGIQ